MNRANETDSDAPRGNSEERPPWLVRQENGAIGEARTRALLLDRFWVLERSADVDGADLIIQRRLTQRSLLDRTAPRLGFVQVKFYASTTTTQYVHREYVLNKAGEPRAEFFAVCHTGVEDGTSAFLLSSEEIAQLPITDEHHSYPNRFMLRGTDVLTPRFEIVDRRHALDRIERALMNADFLKNRAFVSWALPSLKSTPPPILPMYEEGIENWWGDIPSAFNDLRERARKASWEFEDVVSRLQAIYESQDPEQIAAEVEELDDDWGHSHPLMRHIFDEDFFRAVKLYKKRHSDLTQAGLLSAYAGIRRLVKEKLTEDVAPLMPLPRDRVYLLKVSYDPKTWRDIHLRSRFEETQSVWPEERDGKKEADSNRIPSNGVLEQEPGSVEVYVIPGRFGYGEWSKGDYVESEAPWTERLRNVADRMASDVLEQMLTNRFGEYEF